MEACFCHKIDRTDTARSVLIMTSAIYQEQHKLQHVLGHAFWALNNSNLTSANIRKSHSVIHFNTLNKCCY